MTHFWLRTSMIALAGGALTACATAQYPTAEGQARREPLTVPTPNFPITQDGTAATPAEAAPTAAPTGGAIQSQALPPPGAATTAPPTAVASQPLAPLTSATPRMETVTRTVPVAAGKVVDAEGKPVTYQVQSGDTLYAIARKLDTTVSKLAADNGLSEPYRLQPGQTLKGPAPKAKAYTVMSGDTLSAIGRRFSVRAQDIAEANEIALATPINVGQRLVLPAGYKDLGPQTRTITSTQPRYQPPAQVPVPSTATTFAATTLPPPPPPPVTTVASTTPTVVPPTTTVKPATPAQTTPKPYSPPVATPVVPKPYTPPATATVTPKPYTPPATSATSATTPMIATGVPPTDNEVAAAGKGRFLWPVKGDVVSAFGPKGGGQRNDGLNIRAASGSQVQAAAAGEVVYAGDQVPGFGNLVLVKHEGGWVTAYAHLSRIDVKMRDLVMQGQSLGSVGSTGGVAEPQLHFEVRYAPSPKDKARPVDPVLVLPG